MDDTGRDFTAGELEAMLPGLVEIRRQRDDLARAYETGSKPVRAWLDAHPGEELVDGESRVRAYLEDRRGPPEMDVISLASREDPKVLVRLALAGVFKLDAKAWAALSEKGIDFHDAKPFLMPGRGTTALQIKEQK